MAPFTALNGGSPKATSPIINSTEIKPPLAEDRPNSDLKPFVTEHTSNHREGWPDRPSFPARYTDVEFSHKRKRSDSTEPVRENPLAQPERSDEPSSANCHVPPSHHESRDYYTNPSPSAQQHPQNQAQPSQERDYRPPYRSSDEATRDQNRDHWYLQQGQDDRGAQSLPQGEEHSGDNSRRSTTGQAEVDYATTSPDGEERHAGPYDNQYSPDHRAEKVVQGDPKKRKRVFANRTKTGCMTCRRRKKKCDEAKPECANCLRGGFVCSGYQAQKSPWPKQDQKTGVVSIESKDPTYVPPGPYGMPQTNQYGQTVQQPSKSNTLPAPYRGQPPLRINPPTHPILSTDDDRPTASTLASATVASPENKLSAISSAYSNTPGGANVFPTPVSAVPTPFNERQFNRVPSLHDMSRPADVEHPTPVSAQPKGPQLPQINILNPTRSSSPAPAPTVSAGPSSNPQVAAQMALNHSSYPSSRKRTQKEEMLSGGDYYPYDRELELERERCLAACFRFNNACNPNNGISLSERLRMFREIIQPREPIQFSSALAMPNPFLGRLGDNVKVEGQFHCEYGYNLQIGNNVTIGRNCTIMDANEVMIGDNCHIGPNVAIYTNSLPVDPKKRNQGTQKAKAVHIHRDCWISGNVVILPGVVIGKGVTVGAGAVVTRTLPPFTVVAGNPATVLRGVIDPSSS